MGWYNWVNSSTVKKILNTGEKFSKRQLLKFVRFSNNFNTKMFAVHERKTDKYFGNIRLTMISNKHKHCNYGRLIGDKNFKKKGYGKLMLYKICDYSFNNLKLNKIFTHVFTDNKESIKSNKNFGMKIEGRLKKHYYKNGKFKDVLIFSMQKGEFNKIKKKMFK